MGREARQVDAARTDVLAGFAADAVLAEDLGLVLPVVEVGEDEPDGADVDVAHAMAAHQTEDRADVGAGPAAHAAEDLGEDGVLGDLGTAVVQEDHMHDLLAGGGGRAVARAVHEGDVRGQALGRGVARQHLQGRQGHIQRGHELVQTSQHHVHARQGGHHLGIAFIGDGAHAAVLGHGEVAAAHAHVRAQELAAQLHAGHLDQPLHVRVLRDAGGLGEVVGHLLPGKVDGRHDHVRGAFMPQLDDPFAKVGLVHHEAVGLQPSVEVDLLGGHGLGLDDVLDVVLFGDAGDDLVGVGGRGRPMHDDAALFRLGPELGIELFHVTAGVVLGVGDLPDEAAFVHFLEDGFAVGAVGHGKGVQRPAQEAVFQRAVDILVVCGYAAEFFAVRHGHPPEERYAVPAGRARPRRRCARCRRCGWGR